MSEDYVRPPIVAIELRSRRAAVWRFRIAMGMVLLLLIVAVVLIASKIVHSGDGSGTVGAPQPAALLALRR